MSSSEPARFELKSANSLLEISIIGSDFRQVASGVGQLEASVAPGIYQIVSRAGSAVERHLVSLAPGQVHVASDLRVAFPSAAPVAGSATSHEYHQALAVEASQKAGGAMATSWLVVVVRDPRGLAGPPLERSVLDRIELRDRELRPVAGFGLDWDLRAEEGAAAWSGVVQPGPYVLRSRGGAAGPIDRTLWIQAGWQSVVFLTIGPTGDLPAEFSIHMVDVNVYWSPSEERVAEAAELASQALAADRPVVAPDLLELLLNTKFRNPMFGLIGAHALLLQPRVDPGYLGVVLENLDSLLPGHPDAAALRWLATLRLPGTIAPPAVGAGADWPPMLLASYQALLRADAVNPGVILDGSFAERAAANLSVQGIWTAWRPLPAAGPAPAAGEREVRRGGEEAEAGALLTDLAAGASSVASLSIPDPATARVARYLGSVAALEGPERAADRFDAMTTGQLAIATGLPTSTVERSVRELHRITTPERGPGPDEDADGGKGRGHDDGGGGKGGGGKGGFHLPLALVIAVGLVLVVGIGTVIGLAVAGGGSRETPEPTPSATPVPTPSPSATPTPTPIPVPDVQIHPEVLDFGTVLLPEGRLLRLDDGIAAVVVSTGTAPLRVLDAYVDEGADEFRAFREECVERPPLEPGETCDVLVRFVPLAAGPREGTLVIELQDLGFRRVPLLGVGEEQGVIVISPANAYVWEWTPFTVAASGPVRIVDVTLAGETPQGFELDAEGCLSEPQREAGTLCTVYVRLREDVDAGTGYIAELQVTTAAGSRYTASLDYHTIL